MSEDEETPQPEKDEKVVRLYEENVNVDRLVDKFRKVLDKYAYGKMSFAEVIGVLEIIKSEIMEGTKDDT